MTPKVRLTLSYLGIIMAISLFFSVIVYRVSLGEADRGLRHQVNELRDNLYFVRPGALERQRDDALGNYSHRIITQLAYINLGMLGIGAALSYILALRNLEPLEKALEAQARFTSDAAHELRTPLTAMKAETEVGLRDKKLSATDARALLKSNLEEVAKLETLTNALLRLAKNGITPDKSVWNKLSVGSLTQDAVARVETSAKQSGTTFDTSGVGAQYVAGDHDQLVEALVVLLDNAIKYGTPKSTVTVRSSAVKDRVRINVIDQGAGIAKADLPNIFDRFYRADQSRAKANVGGFGLGLSLAKQIIETHGGDISVTSVEGHGSNFTIELPVFVKNLEPSA